MGRRPKEVTSEDPLYSILTRILRGTRKLPRFNQKFAQITLLAAQNDVGWVGVARNPWEVLSVDVAPGDIEMAPKAKGASQLLSDVGDLRAQYNRKSRTIVVDAHAVAGVTERKHIKMLVTETTALQAVERVLGKDVLSAARERQGDEELRTAAAPELEDSELAADGAANPQSHGKSNHSPAGQLPSAPQRSGKARRLELPTSPQGYALRDRKALPEIDRLEPSGTWGTYAYGRCGARHDRVSAPGVVSLLQT